MAVIGKIQKNSVLLLIVIGGAMLAFIFSEAMSNRGGEYEQLATGTVYGEGIDEEEYESIKESYTNRELRQVFQQNNNQPLDQKQREGAEKRGEDNAFNEVIRRDLMNREFEKIGLTVTSDELNDMMHGNHVHPWVSQMPQFMGPTGQFEKDSLFKYIDLLEEEPAEDSIRVYWEQERELWREFEQELKDTRKADKYVALIKRGVFTNSLEVQERYNSNNEVRTIRFVLQRYTDIPQDEIELTDEDLKAYYEEHKDEKQYEMQDSRDVDFIRIPVVPTQADYDSLAKKMEKVKARFEKTDMNINFMASNSDNFVENDSVEFSAGTDALTLPQNQFAPAGTYPLVADDAIQTAEIGDVIGPFSCKNGEGKDIVFIAKLTGAKKEKQAWVRHILVSIDATRTEEEAKAKADEIIAEIKEKDNFVECVEKYSQDPGSIPNGGEYKWFPEGRMVPEFNDASFNGAIGALQLVKTTYGYHIVEVLGRGERTLPKMAVITKNVKPSAATLEETEYMVMDYIYNIENYETEDDSAFWRLAEDSSFTVLNSRIWINQSYVSSMNDYKKMMRFAFGKSRLEGDLSEPILDGDAYVVAQLSNIIEEGAPKFEDVKEQMRFSALKDKQGKVYAEKMAGKQSLAQVAEQVKNGNILTAQITFGGNVIAGGGGNEPEVIGALFRDELKSGVMTTPLVGRTGVYVAILDEIKEAPEPNDLSTERAFLQDSKRGAADNQVIRALREKADVQDNRRKIEYAGR